MHATIRLVAYIIFTCIALLAIWLSRNFISILILLPQNRTFLKVAMFALATSRRCRGVGDKLTLTRAPLTGVCRNLTANSFWSENNFSVL